MHPCRRPKVSRYAFGQTPTHCLAKGCALHRLSELSSGNLSNRYRAQLTIRFCGPEAFVRSGPLSVFSFKFQKIPANVVSMLIGDAPCLLCGRFLVEMTLTEGGDGDEEGNGLVEVAMLFGWQTKRWWLASSSRHCSSLLLISGDKQPRLWSCATLCSLSITWLIIAVSC